MLRSSFFSVGTFVFLWGLTFLFVDKVVIRAKGDEKPDDRQVVANRQQPERGFRGFLSRASTTAETPQLVGPGQKLVDPPDWAAFSLMSVGAVTMLYAFALPRKGKKAD